MAVTTTHSTNKMIRFRTEIVREYVRENLFSPYYGDDITSIIRNIYELKQGGEQINIPLVAKLSGAAKSTGTLVGNEEAIDNYGFRVWLDWARNAVTTNKADQHKDSADVFGEAKPLLSDWGKELQRDELILALHALPSTAAPSGLGSAGGQRVNGILYSAATATEKNAWNAANVDRVQFGASVSNYSGTHATALANVDAAADKLTAAAVTLMKRRARKASPRIRPYKTKDGREYYVLFCGAYQFRDLKGDAVITAANREARAREGDAIDNNPLFQDGDLLYDGVIVREVPEIDDLCTVAAAGASGIDVTPSFLCGQMAATLAWGQMPKPTERKEDDYGFIKGSGVEMAYGVAKLAKIPAGGSALKDWGVYTGYFASVGDA